MRGVGWVGWVFMLEFRFEELGEERDGVELGAEVEEGLGAGGAEEVAEEVAEVGGFSRRDTGQLG